MDDADLELLRRFRADEAEPPADLQARIEERLWTAILAEEAAAHAGRARAGRGWLERWARPLVAAGAAATMAIGVAVISDGGTTGTSLGNDAVIRQAGILDSTAASLFGGAAASTTAAPVVGAVDLSSPDEQDERLARGPVPDDAGLDEASREFAVQAMQSPDTLQARLRAAAARIAGSDPSDRIAFTLAMQWVTSPQAPVELRAAMLRALGGLDGVDTVLPGVDLLGRAGVVLGHLDPRSGVRSQYLLDADDGRLLEQRTFTIAYLDPACPPGTFTGHALYDDEGALVELGDAPWLDWPIVVPTCDHGTDAG